MRPWPILPVAAIALSGCAAQDALHVATGFTAHVLCSQTFVAGRDPEAIYREYVQRTPGASLLGGALRYRVDRERKEVVATVAGSAAARAVYASGRGCTVVKGAARPAAIDFAGAAPFAPDPLAAPPQPVAAADPRIAAAIDRTFAEAPGGPYAGVKAIVVVHDGRIVAERYAPGYGPDTPMQSWSMAKSITNALIGALARDGRLSVDGPAPVAAWKDPADPRHPITIDQLLRQTSGQPFGEAGRALNRATHMQFLEPDTADAAAAARFDGPPGARWAYTDGNYAILSGIIRDRTGGTAGAEARFARNALFAPLGMTTAVQEFDEAGTPMGGSYVYASARDWARFGLLFAGDGAVGERRILPPGWADYSASPTPSAAYGYGAGFWTNRGEAPYAAQRRAAGAPADSFFASGDFGQRLLISPAERLVIVRLGFSQDDGGVLTTRRTVALAAEVVAALHGR